MTEPQQTFSEADLLSAGAQLCYIYTLHASNDPERRPRYVGFTCRPNNRESEHHRTQKNGRKGKWVEQLLSIGERAILTIVHCFRSDDFVERGVVEASWIETYRKKFSDLLNDHGAGNGLAKTSDMLRQKRSEVMKKRCADMEYRKRKSEEMKQRYADPAYREKMNHLNRRRCSSQEDRERRSGVMKKYWSDPKVRQAHSKTLKQAYSDPIKRCNHKAAMADPTWKKKHHVGMKQHCANPAVRKRMSDSAKEQFAKPLARKKAAEFAKRAWENPEYRAKRAATIARKKLEKLLSEY